MIWVRQVKCVSFLLEVTYNGLLYFEISFFL